MSVCLSLPPSLPPSFPARQSVRLSFCLVARLHPSPSPSPLPLLLPSPFPLSPLSMNHHPSILLHLDVNFELMRAKVAANERRAFRDTRAGKITRHCNQRQFSGGEGEKNERAMALRICGDTQGWTSCTYEVFIFDKRNLVVRLSISVPVQHQRFEADFSEEVTC